MKGRSIFQFLSVLLALAFFMPTAQAGDDALHEGESYNPTPKVMHHISDANNFHIVGDIALPLPCIFYASDKGFTFTLSSAFHHGHHAVDGYAMVHDDVMRIKGFPQTEGSVEIKIEGHHGTEKVIYEGKEYELEAASIIGGMTSWYDFSITKNVFTMFLVFLLMFVVFTTVAKAYKKRKGQAPKGLQSFLEPVIVFMRDSVAKPTIGEKWERYFPFILSLFFFILLSNLMGLIPFFPGSANVTGNISVTIVLAVIVFIVVTLSGSKHYWEHIVWMPGVPALVKIILTPIEILGIFIRPATLFIRLFANITAGHIIILSLVSLIFVFGNAGESMSGSWAGAAVAVPFVFIMNLLELLVAFLQAFIFALLASLYIGTAVETGHGHGEAAHH